MKGNNHYSAFLWIAAVLAVFLGAVFGTKVLADSGFGYVMPDASASAANMFAGAGAADASGYIFADSDSRSLTEEDIADLSPQELCYAKNELYARHGRIFESFELQNYFGQKAWYQGTVSAGDFSDTVFTQTETANISLLDARLNELGDYVLDQPGYTYDTVRSFPAGGDSIASEASDAALPDSDFIFADSDRRYLSESELSGLSLQTLCYARSEIYARRGYIFNSLELQDYFSAKDWYVPDVPAASFSPEVFNEYEAANVELLKRYEYSLSPNGYQLY